LENRKIFDVSIHKSQLLGIQRLKSIQIEQHLAQIKHLDETIRRYLFQGFLELASSNMHMAELEAAEAAFQICVCYCLGFGVAADDGEARNWLVKSAWKGLVKARGLVKRLFDACEAEVPPNTPTREWLIEATLGGCPIAAAELEITDGSEHHILLRQRICKSDIDLLKCHYPLDEGIFRGLAPRLEELSANNPDLRINDAGDTFLHFVAVHGGVKLAEDSWRMGVWKNIDEVNNEQESALLLACRAGNEGMIEYLTQNGANVQRASKKGVTPLHWAVTMKRGFSISRIARMLVEAGADTEAETNCVIKQSLHSHHINDLPQGTPLAWVISISHVAAVKVLLELDAFATRSHLLAAAFIHDFKTIEILLQEQHLLDEEYCPSDLKDFDESNKSILAYAISGENRFSSLIRHGSQYRSTVRSTLELLLQKGADPECVDITYSGSGDTALMHAVRNSPVEILEMLLNSCPEQLDTHCGDISPIKWTIENENEEKFSFLMDHKAAIEGVCDESNGSTLLHHCAYSMNHGAFFAAAIIDRGADIYARSATGYTPVREAVCNGNIDLAKFLICKGGSLSDIDSNGCTTLGSTLTTCSAASLAGVEFLLETSSPNYLVHPERGLGALHFGVCLADKLHDSSIHRQIYDLLLARFKSNLDDVDISGWSPLHLAAAFADPYALRMLLKAGANFSIRDGHGYTPLDIARMTTGLEPSAFWVFGSKLERIESIQQRITRSRLDTSPSASALTEFGDAMESEWGLENFSEKRSTVIEFLAEWIEKAGEH